MRDFILMTVNPPCFMNNYAIGSLPIEKLTDVANNVPAVDSKRDTNFQDLAFLTLILFFLVSNLNPDDFSSENNHSYELPRLYRIMKSCDCLVKKLMQDEGNIFEQAGFIFHPNSSFSESNFLSKSTSSAPKFTVGGQKISPFAQRANTFFRNSLTVNDTFLNSDQNNVF